MSARFAACRSTYGDIVGYVRFVLPGFVHPLYHDKSGHFRHFVLRPTFGMGHFGHMGINADLVGQNNYDKSGHIVIYGQGIGQSILEVAEKHRNGQIQRKPDMPDKAGDSG